MKPGSRIRVICAKMNRRLPIRQRRGSEQSAGRLAGDFVELDRIAQQLTSKDRS